MKVHLNSGDGGAKCGVNVYLDPYPNGYDKPKVNPPVRKISSRLLLYFEDLSRGRKANCKRCLNKVERAKTVEANDDLTGKVFHYSFGYDMTINVYAKAIKKTKKGWICRELAAIGWGNAYGPGSTGKTRASNEFKKDAKPFLMLKKLSKCGHTYFTGNGETWHLIDADESHYENHCD